jgi:hypothetical protein
LEDWLVGKAIAYIAAGVGIAALSLVTGGTATLLGVKLFTDTFLISTGVAVSLQGVATALRKAPGSQGKLQGVQVITRQSDAIRRVIMGEQRVGGTVTFEKALGPNNVNLHMLVTISGCFINDVKAIVFDGQRVPTLNGEGLDQYRGRIFYSFGVGDDGQQANGSLIADTSGIWEASMRQRGCANVYVRLNYLAEAFPNGLPVISFDVEGIRSYDPRTSEIGLVTGATDASNIVITSVGHGLSTGDRIRLEQVGGNTAANGYWFVIVLDADTFELDGSEGNGTYTSGGRYFKLTYTTNAALLSAQVMVMEKMRGGIGLDYDELIEDVLIAAANICDEDITLPDDTTEKRYTINGTFDFGKPEDVIPKLAGAMAGVIVPIGGKWAILPGAFRLPVLTIEDKDIIRPIELITAREIRDLYNGVKGTYLSPLNNWQETDFPPVKSDTYLAEDGGDRVWKDIQLAFTISPFMCQRIAKIDLERNRRQKSAELVCTSKVYEAQPGNVVQWTHTRFGGTFTDKYFEVASMVIDREKDAQGRPIFVVKPSLVESDLDVYGFAVDDYGELVDPELAGLVPRTVPYGWSPAAMQGQPATATPTLRPVSDWGPAITQTYDQGAGLSAVPKLKITGRSVINSHSTTIHSPRCSLTGSTSSTGGFIKGGITLYGCVVGSDCSAPDGAGKYTKASDITKFVIPLGTNTNKVKFEDIRWDENNLGWVIFLSDDPYKLSRQVEHITGDAIGSTIAVTGPDDRPTSIEFKGFSSASIFQRGFYEHYQGVPDALADHLKARVKRGINFGIWGGEVVSVNLDGDEITVNGAFTPNTLAGRYVSVIGVRDKPFDPEEGTGMPQADFLIEDNTADTLILAAGQSVASSANGFAPGNVVVISTLVTDVGSDADGNWVQDDQIGNGGQPFGAFNPGSILRFIGPMGDPAKHTAATIKFVATNKVYIDGEWDVVPAAGAVFITEEQNWRIEYDTTYTPASSPDLFPAISIDIPNERAQQLFVQVFTVSQDGKEPYWSRCPYRLIYIFGQADPGVLVTVDFAPSPTDGIIRVDTTLGDVNITLRPADILPGRPVVVINQIGSNNVIVKGTGTDQIDGAATDTLPPGEVGIYGDYKDA